MNYKEPLFAFLFIALIAGGVYMCDRQEEAAKVPAGKPETIRKRISTTNATESAKYQKEAQYWKARFKADSTAKAEAARKDKLQTEKASHSAANYAESGKHEDCSTALTDCQEENETKAYSIAVQERMIAGLDSSNALKLSEIDRQSSVIDTLGKGWEKANVENGKLEKKVKNRNKLLKIGAGIIAVLGILVAAR